MAHRTLTIDCAPVEEARFGPRDEASTIGGIDVHVATLTRLHRHIGTYATWLDPQEQERADRFRFAHDRERFILGHGLLRDVLGARLGQHPAEVVTRRGEFGKPFLADSDLHFNLSDTKDAVLVAVSPGAPIGADIETMHRDTDHHAVSKHYFTPTEVMSIPAGEAGKHRFLELWTRKEAVLKASGVGIMDDLRSLDVGAAHNHMTIRHPDFMRLAAMHYHVRSFHWGSDHLVAIATERPMTAVRFVDAAIDHRSS